MEHKKDLQKLIQDLETKRFRDGEAKGLMSAIQEEQTKALTPVLESLFGTVAQTMIDKFEQSVKALKVDVPKAEVSVKPVDVQFADFPAWPAFPKVEIPEIKIPEIHVPTPRVDVHLPDAMKVTGSVELAGVTKKAPLPVQLMGPDGKPFQMNIPVMGGGGGKGDYFTIRDIQNSTGGSIIDADGNVKVAGSFSVSASNSSTQAIDSSGNVYSASNPFPVTVVAGAGSSTKAQIGNSDGDYSVANPLPVSAAQIGTWTVRGDIGNGVSDTSNQPVGVGGRYLGTPGTYTDGDRANLLMDINGRAQVAVTSITTSVAASMIDSSGVGYSGSNPLPVTVVAGAASSTKAQIGNSDGDFSVANPLPITGPVVVTSVTNTIAAANVDSSGIQYSGSNPMPVTLISGTISSTKAQIGNSDGDFSVANPLPITGPVVVTSVTNSLAVVALDRDGNPLTTGPIAQGDSATALRVVIAGNSDASVAATQVGTWNIGTVTTVTGITNTVAALNVDSSGVGYSGSNPLPVTLISGSISSTKAQIGNSDGDFSVANPLPITGPVVVTSITNTVAALNVDSSGVGYSGSNPLPVTIVAGAGSSTIAQIGNTDGNFTQANPLPVVISGGASSTTNAVLTRQTNPTAVAADYVPLSADDLGRQITRPVQVRDLIKTAYVTLSTGTEATLLAGVAGAFLDLIYIMGANTSNNAQQVDIRATTAGNIVQTLYIPANATAGVALQVPWPQDNQGNSWTVDMADVTNSNILISALFSQEV